MTPYELFINEDKTRAIANVGTLTRAVEQDILNNGWTITSIVYESDFTFLMLEKE